MNKFLTFLVTLECFCGLFWVYYILVDLIFLLHCFIIVWVLLFPFSSFDFAFAPCFFSLQQCLAPFISSVFNSFLSLLFEHLLTFFSPFLLCLAFCLVAISGFFPQTVHCWGPRFYLKRVRPFAVAMSALWISVPSILYICLPAGVEMSALFVLDSFGYSDVRPFWISTLSIFYICLPAQHPLQYWSIVCFQLFGVYVGIISAWSYLLLFLLSRRFNRASHASKSQTSYISIETTSWILVLFTFPKLLTPPLVWAFTCFGCGFSDSKEACSQSYFHASLRLLYWRPSIPLSNEILHFRRSEDQQSQASYQKWLRHMQKALSTWAYSTSSAEEKTKASRSIRCHDVEGSGKERWTACIILGEKWILDNLPHGPHPKVANSDGCFSFCVFELCPSALKAST